MGSPPDHYDVFDVIPDFLNDLNACHEMEKVLTQEQAYAYAAFMAGDLPWPEAVMSTAPQRCESFLKVLGLWEDGE